MMNFGNFSGLAFKWHLHGIFVGILFLGIVFFIIWAVKYLSKTKIKTWTIWLIIIGIIGMLATSSWGWAWHSMQRGSGGVGMMMEHMEADEHEDAETVEDLREHMLEEMEEHMGF